MLRKVVLLLLILAIAVPIVAQEAVEPRCTKADIEIMLTMLNAGIAPLLEETDMATVFQALTAQAGIYRQINALCNPLSFQGDSNIVIGPVSIPSGFYRVTLTGDSNTAVETELMDGDCDYDGFYYLSSAGGSMEVIYQSEGCTVLLAVSNAETNWSLVFEKIG